MGVDLRAVRELIFPLPSHWYILRLHRGRLETDFWPSVYGDTYVRIRAKYGSQPYTYGDHRGRAERSRYGHPSVRTYVSPYRYVTVRIPTSQSCYGDGDEVVNGEVALIKWWLQKVDMQMLEPV